MPCPRWDSNGIPRLGNAGKRRKHAESGAARRVYEAVRGGKCGHCPHFFASIGRPSGHGTLSHTLDVP